jgi:hypothetical protein
MDSMLIYLYAGVGIVTAVAAYVASRRISRFSPTRTVRIVTSLVAGALWPIVVVGLAQVAVVVLYVKYAKPRELSANQGATESIDARF